jgi:peroxiredoxin Q/BCP
MSLRGIINVLTRGEGKMLTPGESAPDFDAVDHQGNRVKLSGLRGKKVILWFYPKADTPG